MICLLLYRNQAYLFHSWRVMHLLILNVLKNKEMVFDPRELILHKSVVTGGG